MDIHITHSLMMMCVCVRAPARASVDISKAQRLDLVLLFVVSLYDFFSIFAAVAAQTYIHTMIPPKGSIFGNMCVCVPWISEMSGPRTQTEISTWGQPKNKCDANTSSRMPMDPS